MLYQIPMVVDSILVKYVVKLIERCNLKLYMVGLLTIVDTQILYNLSISFYISVKRRPTCHIKILS